MRMTVDEARRRFPDRRAPIPLEFAGQWIAWNTDRTEIVAHGAAFGEVRARALTAGHPEPLMQRVLGRSFVGEA
jgi:hypothetical protein